MGSSTLTWWSRLIWPVVWASERGKGRTPEKVKMIWSGVTVMDGKTRPIISRK